MSPDQQTRGLNILFLGDIVAAVGRKAVIRATPLLREALSLDLLCANAENAAHGFGLTPSIAEQLLEAGLDLLTTGNHVWDQPLLIDYLRENPTAPILRPLNMHSNPASPLPGRGYADLALSEGKVVRVVNIIGQVFMEPCAHPWFALEPLLAEGTPLEAGWDALLIDCHAETTGEKMALAHLCDGKATAFMGTHTHIPTADATVLPKGLGYQTDLGMCGCYDSVIGFESTLSVARYLKKIPRVKFDPAQGSASLSGVFVETDPATGYARRIEALRISAEQNGSLPSSLPQALPQALLPYKKDLQEILTQELR